MWDIYIHFSLLLLNLFVCLYKYKYLSTWLKVLGGAVLVTFLLEGYAAYLMLHQTRNLHLYHFFTPLQYALYAFIFYQVLEKRNQKRMVLLSIPIYILASAGITVFLQGFSTYNTYALSLKNVLTICWVLLYYNNVFTSLRIVRLNREPMFRVSTGLLFYAMGSFFIDGLMNQVLAESFAMANALFYISIFLGFLLYFTFLVAFVLAEKVPASVPSSVPQKVDHQNHV